MEIQCPHCSVALTEEELRRLWATYCASKKSSVRAKASALNGRKGGRPFKLKAAGDGNIFNIAGYVQECMKKVGRRQESIVEFDRQLWKCKNYEEALKLCAKIIKELNQERGLPPQA